MDETNSNPYPGDYHLLLGHYADIQQLEYHSRLFNVYTVIHIEQYH